MKVRSTKDRRLVISSLSVDSPAQTAGLRAGDTITAINGKKPSEDEFFTLMHYNRGEIISVTIDRNCFESDHAIQPVKIFSAPPSIEKIKELLYLDRRKVRIAVIVADVRHTVQGDLDRSSWERSVRHQHQVQTENDLLRNFADTKDFSLVARPQLERTISEYHVSSSALASEDVRTKIGTATGATHLLVADVTRVPDSPDGGSWVDEYQQRLIDVTNGQVLAIDRQKNRAYR